MCTSSCGTWPSAALPEGLARRLAQQQAAQQQRCCRRCSHRSVSRLVGHPLVRRAVPALLLHAWAELAALWLLRALCRCVQLNQMRRWASVQPWAEVRGQGLCWRAQLGGWELWQECDGG